MSLQARLQRRIQHHGWELSSAAYQFLWQSQRSRPHQRMLALAEPGRSERVLDVGCGTGLIALAAADKVGPAGQVMGVDCSLLKLEVAQEHAQALGLENVRFLDMESMHLPCADACIDLLYCVLAMPSMPDPRQVLREMHRVLRPGGRIALAVWGERAHCAWSSAFSLMEEDMGLCTDPVAFHWDGADALAGLCRETGFVELHQERTAALMHYGNVQEACDAAFAELEPVWSTLDAHQRARIESRYVQAISPWRSQTGYSLPAQFVLVVACKPARIC